MKAMSEDLGRRSLCADLGCIVNLEIHADSSAAIGICKRSGIGRVRHLSVGQLWVQERIRSGEVKLFKVAGEFNPADAFTKPLARDVLDRHLHIMGLMRAIGRAETAPNIVG